jgi:hypothetical protein
MPMLAAAALVENALAFERRDPASTPGASAAR